jgi:hypothetical protein
VLQNATRLEICKFAQTLIDVEVPITHASQPFFLLSASQEHAFESSQKYKEGKFIIELAHMIKENKWD